MPSRRSLSPIGSTALSTSRMAWQAAGIEPEKIATLCRIAGMVDNGTFEAAG